MHTGPEIDGLKEMGESTDDTTVSYCLSILADDVARAKIDNNTCSKEIGSIRLTPPFITVTLCYNDSNCLQYTVYKVLVSYPCQSISSVKQWV